MTSKLSFSGYTSRLKSFIRRHTLPSSARDHADETDEAFNSLALDLFALQFEEVAAYRQLCAARGIAPGAILDWREIPAVPTAAFKEFDFSSLPVEQRTVVFHSSGTTARHPSRHFHNGESLELYEASLLPWFREHLIPELGDPDCPGLGKTPEPLETLAKLPMLLLTPSPALAPHSSLVHMFESVRRAYGATESFFAGALDENGAWALNRDATLDALQSLELRNRPVALLGTAFSFVHLIDELEARQLRFALARGSRVLETGGYKGRSRALPKSALHALIAERLGIPECAIISEYGMSELSSQAYDRRIGGPLRDGNMDERIFRFPPWARAMIVSPETGQEVPFGESGLIRVYDLANARSVLAVQTEDLGIRRRSGLELLGRSAAVEPRGCSLMAR